MFRIYDGRTDFYQWDIDRKLIIEDSSINQVHFCNRTDSCSLGCDVYEENGQRLVNVPNVLLQNDWRINVYGYDKNYTKHSAVFDVVKRSKPADYVYTETEVVNWETIQKKLDEIDENIGSAVKEYLDENPIEVPEPDLTDYYNKTETDAAIEQAVAAIEIPSTTGLATEKYVDDKVAAIEIPEPDLSEYAKKSEIPTKTSQLTNDSDYVNSTEMTNTLKAYATHVYVDEAIAAIDVSDMPDFSDYYTKEQTDEVIKAAITNINSASVTTEDIALLNEIIYAETITRPLAIDGKPVVAIKVFGQNEQLYLATFRYYEVGIVQYQSICPEVYVWKHVNQTLTHYPSNVMLFDTNTIGAYYKGEFNNSKTLTDLLKYLSENMVENADLEAKGYQTEAQVLALINANMPADASEVSY